MKTSSTLAVQKLQVWFLVVILLLAASVMAVIVYGFVRSSQAMNQPIIIHTTEAVSIVGDTRFVASRRGTYYYPLLSERGQALAEKNRVYFKTEEEALRAGFVHWK